MQIRIDHVTVCGAELEPLAEAFAAGGLVPEYGGPHANGVTHMALLGFQDGSYLELIAPLKPGRADGSPWGKLMLGDAGAGAWAIRTHDIRGDVVRLNSLGIETEGPTAGSRRRPDGKVLEWQTASVGPGTPGAMLPFLIQDHTPREWRVQPSASLMGSGLNGIEAVVLGVNQIDSACASFRQAYNLKTPLMENHAEFGARIAYFEGSPIMLAEPLSQDSWLASRIGKFGDTPAGFLLRTGDLKQTAKGLELASHTHWFGDPVAWWGPEKLRGIRLGIIER